MNYTGKIIVLAFPDTFVTMSTELICKLLPLVGLGTRDYIKAGHAALVLIENNTGRAYYYDFGRYVTPKGHGRVRGETTDAELHVPIIATFKHNKELANLDDFLYWLDANPQKTHGEGRLLASVCDAINFEKAKNYITELQQRGSIPYGAFAKDGSNCARFVTDTILAATKENKIIKSLKFNKKFTPSTVGNVEKGALHNNIYEVFDGTIQPFKGSAFKENLTNYFDRSKNLSACTSEIPALLKNANLQKLEGTGSDAWFEITNVELPQYHFNIKRYNALGKVDFDGVFLSEQFNKSLPYSFTYDSHCEYCHVLQNGEKIKLNCVGSLRAFNSLRKQHSA